MRSVHKAARAISGKIEVHDLIQTMMTIVMESAGADGGAFLLEKDGEWQIEARADLRDEGVEVGFPSHRRESATGTGCSVVPSSVVNYVLRIQSAVTVNEPARDPRFGQDAYILHVMPRSILCVPVVKQGQTTGIIYLENKLGPDVFSADRRDVIDVLAGQIAISLENATLFADLKSTVDKQNEMMVELASQQDELRESNGALVEQRAAVVSARRGASATQRRDPRGQPAVESGGRGGSSIERRSGAAGSRAHGGVAPIE